MNGKLVDTNILIYLSKRILNFEKVASVHDKLFISVITYMEVLGYTFQSQTEKQLVEQLCQQFPVINLKQEIIDKIIAIRQHHKIKLPDAIILATASIEKLELITANVADFINIVPELKINNPMG